MGKEFLVKPVCQNLSVNKINPFWEFSNRNCFQNFMENNLVSGYSLSGHTEKIKSVAFHPNGQILATGSEDKTLKLWNLKTGQLISSIIHQEKVYAVAFSPSGKLIVSGCGDKMLRLYSINQDAPSSLEKMKELL